MEHVETDVAIVGAGTAGLAALRAARNYTERVLLIEGGPYGTTCARVGCMPSKLLIAAADAAHAVRGARQFGIRSEPPRIDGAAVMARVRAERDRFVGMVVADVEALPHANRLRGQARFLSPTRLHVDAHTEVNARAVVLATGASPAVPSAFTGLGDRLVTNDDIFEWRTLPASIAVVGAGVIGLELAQALARLGVRTQLLGRGGGVGPLSDPELVDSAARLLGADLALDADAEIIALARDGEQVRVRWRAADGGERTEHFEYVLAATGRAPNLRRLGLEALPVERGRGDVPEFDPHTLQVGRLPVFIAGDVNHDRPLLHEAADEGRVAGENAACYPEVRAWPRRAALSIVFCDPQIAIVGCGHAALAGTEHATGRVAFEDQGRARVLGRNCGALHVYGAYGSGRVLGAEMLGPAAEHIGHLLAWSVQQQLTVQQMLDMPFYHPVLEEGVRSALRDLRRRLAMGPAPVPHSLDCGPGA